MLKVQIQTPAGLTVEMAKEDLQKASDLLHRCEGDTDAAIGAVLAAKELSGVFERSAAPDELAVAAD